MPSTELAVRAPATELVDTLIRNDETAIAQLKAALPENVTPTRFMAALQTALIDDAIEQRDPGKRLLTADRASLFQAVVKCASDGLLPDRREAALVRYGDKVQYLPMISGARKIAAQFGWTIRTHAVYANDQFDVIEGTEQRVEHRSAPLGTDRGNVIAAYAVAHHRDGRTGIVEVMTLEDIEKARSSSKVPNGPGWKNWYSRMAEKTVGHRIAKKLPLDPADREKLMRVLDAAELDPGEAALTLYSRPADDTPVHDEPQAGGAVNGSQQAGDVPSSPEASPAPGAADFGDTDPGEEDDDMAAATAAAGYKVTVPKKDNWVNGLTLAQIYARGEDGLKFFRWALTVSDARGANHNDALRAQAAAYAKVRLPELHAELVEAGE